jgi:hypothetical protein
MNKPYLIITLGPTGSGKTNLVYETIKYLDLDPNFKKFIVDDLVENNQGYKEQVLSIIKNVEEKCKQEKKHCSDVDCEHCDTQPYYLNPDRNLLKQFNDAYFGIKNSNNCIPSMPYNCNEINDMLLADAISKRENIILESTGGFIPKWILSGAPFVGDISKYSGIPYISHENPYHVIFAYSCVPFSDLVKRNLNRTIVSIDKFTQDTSLPAPRLPDISPNNFKKKIKLIINVLLDLYKNCIKYSVEKKCGTQRIDDLLIFDNSDSMQLVFDSKKDKLTVNNLKHLLNNLFKLDTPAQGGNKKSKNNIINAKRKRKVSKKIIHDN